MAIPAVTLPPGELIYMWIGFVLLSDCLQGNNYMLLMEKQYRDLSNKWSCFGLWFTCKNSNWATISELMLSLIPPIKQMIRSLSNREKISYDRSPRPVCSITIGTKPNIFRHDAWICLLKPKFYGRKSSTKWNANWLEIRNNKYH